jgi:hypothetical protein
LKTVEEEVGEEFLQKAADPVIAGYLHSMLMVGCFSLDGDLLSQWRAYADDGRGFAIGFAPGRMQTPAKPLRVLYDPDEQLQELLGNLRHIFNYEKSIGFKYDNQFQSHMYHLGLDLVAYKHPAFGEEREIRLAHACGAIAGQPAKIVAAGALGPDGERLAEPLPTHFRMRNGLLIPYVIMDYSNNGTAAPVKDVILGPQNANNVRGVEIFLSSVGLTEVAVRRSSAPYLT